MTDETGAPNDPEMLAAEYALGLLAPRDQAAAAARIAHDADFAERVARWEAMGHGWASEAPADKGWSPDALWQRMEATFPSAENLRTVPVPANDTDAASAAIGAASGWRMGAMAASVAALMLGGLYLGERDRAQTFGVQLAQVQSQNEAARSAVRVAQVSQSDGAPLLSVMYEGRDGTLTARIATIAKGDLVPELWVIGPDGTPRSLGQSPSGSVFVVELTEKMRADIAAGSAIAISLEKPADLPSLQPTAERILGAAQLAPVS